MSRWLAEGRTLGASLRRFHAIVVAGSEPDAVADVALGVAEAQCLERKVILGDLTGNNARFASLGGDEDPHGLVDAFDYGISLDRVSRAVAAGNRRRNTGTTANNTPSDTLTPPEARWRKMKPLKAAARSSPSNWRITRCRANASGRRRYTAQFSSQPPATLEIHRSTPVRAA